MTNIKMKNKIIIATFLLSLFLCYKLAILKTINARQQLNILSKESVQISNTSKELYQLKIKESYYDSLLNTYQFKNLSIQNQILNILNEFSSNGSIEIKKFKEPHTIEENELIIKTFDLTIKANYNNIIKLVHHFEQKERFSEIINLNLKKIKNHKTGKYFLQAKILLKSFE